MEHFVGCHIIESANQEALWIHQPKLLKNLNKHFGSTVAEIGRTYPTPASPRFVATRPLEGDPVLEPTEQKKFRTGVGMLLYLVKHSRPDIANAVGKLYSDASSMY
jgi:hypothetical protein